MLFESRHGNDLGSNILRLMIEVKKKYGNAYKLYLSCAPEKKKYITKILNEYKLCGVILLNPRSLGYFKILATAKFLFNDTTFTNRYIKKDGQIVVNTWHGTPLKAMGRHVRNDAFAMGNVQRNLLFSDFLIFPNDFMQSKMTSAYMLDGVFKGTILNVGYPRNQIFFEIANNKIRKKFELCDKKVYAYMPTWRGITGDVESEKQICEILEYLRELDESLGENEVMLCKFHPFVGNCVDFSDFKHIRKFPGGVDGYDVLNEVDCLVTDYSSVMFDFANTKKKIVLFAYDMEKYFSDRGVYVNLSDLPFPKCENIKQLVDELRCEKNYTDDDFLKRFCTYDCTDASEKIVSRVFENKTVCKETKLVDKTKENVLIFSGNLAKNGITTALLSLFNRLDTDKKRYFVTFQQGTLRDEPERALMFPEGVNIFPMATKPQYTLSEAVAQGLLYKFNIGSSWVINKLNSMCKREIERFFGGIDFDFVVEYEGYGKNMLHLFKNFDCKKIIFVHNNMVEELKNKNIQHRITLENCYKNYDKIACVTEDLVDSTAEIAENREKICVVNNCHDYKNVINRASEELTFDEDTVCNVEFGNLCKILDGNDLKIINIGRFSWEKGHDLLIKAFEKVYKENVNSYLIIIGGYGKLYDETLELAEKSVAKGRIVVIKSLKNPMPILKKCDLFVLSSRYEGLGLTLLEAESLKIPVISTNVCGPRGFMEKYGGRLVEPTVDGLYDGISAFSKDKFGALNVDFESYNACAVKDFEKLFEENTDFSRNLEVD